MATPKKRRKLFTAFSLILISAAIAGTASYAWFTMNDKVNAGMEIEAVAAKNLVICETVDGTYTTSVDLSDTDIVKTLSPVSTVDCENWFIPQGDTGIVYETGAITDDTSFEKLSATAGFVRTGTVYIKAEMDLDDTSSAAFATLYVSGIRVERPESDGQSGITDALRIGVVCGTNTLIFAYKNLEAASATEAVESVDGDGKPTLQNISTSAVGTGAVIAEGVGASPVEVQLFLWYEGQDDACTSHNSVKVENVNVSIEFVGSR